VQTDLEFLSSRPLPEALNHQRLVCKSSPIFVCEKKKDWACLDVLEGEDDDDLNNVWTKSDRQKKHTVDTYSDIALATI